MLFGEKLKKLRTEAGLSQSALGEKIGVTQKTIMNYEKGNRYPQTAAIIQKLALIFNVPQEYFISDEDRFILDAEEKGGYKAKRDARQIVEELGGMFAGGEMKDEDKEYVFRAITDLYWDSKDKNKKYTPKGLNK